MIPNGIACDPTRGRHAHLPSIDGQVKKIGAASKRVHAACCEPNNAERYGTPSRYPAPRAMLDGRGVIRAGGELKPRER